MIMSWVLSPNEKVNGRELRKVQKKMAQKTHNSIRLFWGLKSRPTFFAVVLVGGKHLSSTSS